MTDPTTDPVPDPATDAETEGRPGLRRTPRDAFGPFTPEENALWAKARRGHWKLILQGGAAVGASLAALTMLWRLVDGRTVGLSFLLASMAIILLGSLAAAILSRQWLDEKRIDLIRSKRLRDAMRDDDGAPLDDADDDPVDRP